MKRIKVRPGKYVTVSDDVAAKASRATAAFHFSREDVERIAAFEPRHATVYCGPIKSAGVRSIPRMRRLQQAALSDHQRVALKVRELLDASGTHADQRDIDRWVNQWLVEPLVALGGTTPSHVLHTTDGWPKVLAVLERMSGGLPG